MDGKLKQNDLNMVEYQDSSRTTRGQESYAVVFIFFRKSYTYVLLRDIIDVPTSILF